MMGFEFPAQLQLPLHVEVRPRSSGGAGTCRSAAWFRDYVYIPLGGNRWDTPRFVLNTMIVWGLTGIWHGAAWNFLLRGLVLGRAHPAGEVLRHEGAR